MSVITLMELTLFGIALVVFVIALIVMLLRGSADRRVANVSMGDGEPI